MHQEVVLHQEEASHQEVMHNDLVAYQSRPAIRGNKYLQRVHSSEWDRDDINSVFQSLFIFASPERDHTLGLTSLISIPT